METYSTQYLHIKLSNKLLIHCQSCWLMQGELPHLLISYADTVMSIISKRPSISWLAFWTITILVWFRGQIDSNSLNSFMSQIPQWVKGKRKQCDILYSSEITFSACVKEGKCVADIFRLKFSRLKCVCFLPLNNRLNGNKIIRWGFCSSSLWFRAVCS